MPFKAGGPVMPHRVEVGVLSPKLSAWHCTLSSDTVSLSSVQCSICQKSSGEIVWAQQAEIRAPRARGWGG